MEKLIAPVRSQRFASTMHQNAVLTSATASPTEHIAAGLRGPGLYVVLSNVQLYLGLNRPECAAGHWCPNALGHSGWRFGRRRVLTADSSRIGGSGFLGRAPVNPGY